MGLLRNRPPSLSERIRTLQYENKRLTVALGAAVQELEHERNSNRELRLTIERADMERWADA